MYTTVHVCTRDRKGAAESASPAAQERLLQSGGLVTVRPGPGGGIAALSPNLLLRSIYTSLVELIEVHTLEVLPSGEMPIGDSVAERYRSNAPMPRTW
jgi:hypothetical protein